MKKNKEFFITHIFNTKYLYIFSIYILFNIYIKRKIESIFTEN